MKERYLFISNLNSYPCNLADLRYTINIMKGRMPFRDSWPHHGHGPEFRFKTDTGYFILDLSSNKPTRPLTKDELNLLLEG